MLIIMKGSGKYIDTKHNLVLSPSHKFGAPSENCTQRDKKINFTKV